MQRPTRRAWLQGRERQYRSARGLNNATVRKLRTICLCCVLALAAPAGAYDGLREDNPFVEAMLRMMEMFGLIDRSRLPLGVPYLPGYDQALSGGLGGLAPLYGLGNLSPGYGLGGLGGLGGLSGLGGLGGMPGGPMLPGQMLGQGAIPGQLPGLGAWPNAGMPGVPGYGLPGNPLQQWPGQRAPVQSALDGVWELNKGGFVIIRGNRARLYLSRDQYQDFTIAYDRRQLSWAPVSGGTASRYRYEERDGRMILRDSEGNYLLLRKRR